jgi:hypothetical protein
MEDQIAAHPERFLGERELVLVSRQLRIGPYRFDLLFADRHGGKLIVEIQRGTLDREHTYKVLDYYDEYREKNPREFIDVMVVANQIPVERKKRLHALGIAFREIPESLFIVDSTDLIAAESDGAPEQDSFSLEDPGGEAIGNANFKSLGPSPFVRTVRAAIEHALREHPEPRQWKVGGESSLTVLHIPVSAEIGREMRAQIWMERPKNGAAACKFEIAGGTDTVYRERLASALRRHFVQRHLPAGTAESSGSTVIRCKLSLPAIMSQADDTPERVALYSQEVDKAVRFFEFLDQSLDGWKPGF